MDFLLFSFQYLYNIGMKLLMIEDKVSLTDAVAEYFKREQISITVKNDGESGYLEALSGTYDVIILDIMLPKKDGWSILTDLRKEHINTPVLMLSALGEIDDKIKGLNLGADDYLAKPFAIRELDARVKALSRRKEEIKVNNKTVFDITLNRDTHELSCKENRIVLGTKEFEILDLLMEKFPNQVSKEFLTVKIWGYDSDTLYNNAEVYISFLRRKLKAMHSKVEISSIRSLGYKLEYENDK
jgi:Response regulators consisting of a CheY-like receiver domain and a winged-helix DNA-binding domain